MTKQSIKISKLIQNLNAIKSECGDLQVYLSSDSEGNSYGTIEYGKSFGTNKGSKVLVLYPFIEQLEYEDIDPDAPDFSNMSLEELEKWELKTA